MKKLNVILLPIIYIILGIILFGKQELMIVIFLSLSLVLYSYLIDIGKWFLKNFVELTGIFIILFTVSFFLKTTDIILVIQYLSLVISSFTTVYLIKKNQIILKNN